MSKKGENDKEDKEGEEQQQGKSANEDKTTATTSYLFVRASEPQEPLVEVYTSRQRQRKGTERSLCNSQFHLPMASITAAATAIVGAKRNDTRGTRR